MTDETEKHLKDIGADVSMDLDDINTTTAMSKAAACHIVHPVTKKPTGAVIWLFGKDSTKVQDYVNGEANAQLAREAAASAKGDSPPPPTVEKSLARTIDMLCVATDRWEGVNFGGKKNVAFTVAEGRALYANKEVREQCLKFIGDIDRFMNG